ncbi:Major Facilitator Superfamily [Nakaseomyces glabratus]|nr:Major Facilitator Superfamily [Nakaseomyces glabratus]KAH7590475.1 Major Facilitator Superfamily [Nakaseomyces glabratus]KAI8396185.1 Major Facilitator Superfamily [Nakaseomyces glabratus]KTB14301.1 putative transporter ESBP6 [Nakaseomyces glabratus]KTB20820.1 putative transporter ESBP6 [Nakaseomyces glabratus]
MVEEGSCASSVSVDSSYERSSLEVRSYTRDGRDADQYKLHNGNTRTRTLSDSKEGVWRALTNDGTSIVDVLHVRDQSPHESEVKDLKQADEKAVDYDEEDDRLLESRFDLADALRLVDTRQSMQDKENVQIRNRRYSGDDESIKSAYQSEDSIPIERVPTIKKVFTNKSTGQLDLPPDGGYGWVCVFCVFLAMFSTWGCNSGFGVFLGFYLNNDTYPGATKYDYALIAGLTVALGQGASPFVMVMMRVIGMKPTMLFGNALLLAGFLLASFSTKIWQLYLTQGVMSGASIAIVCVPATVVLPGWFLKRRAVAVGLSLLGTGLGGMVYGLAANKMIQSRGNTHLALRVLAITCTVSNIVATVLIKERVPKKPVGIRSWKAIVEQFKVMFTIDLVKKPFVLLIATWFSLALLGYIIMVFTMSPYAIARGMTAHNASALTAILNAAQSVGRPTMGLAGDRFGRTNVTITMTTLLMVFVFGFWIPAHTFLQMIFFSICVGSCVGVANVMNTVLIADMVGPEEFLPAWAFVCYIGSPLCLVAEVIAQALTVPEHKSNPYLHTQIFAGCCFTAALLLALMLREYSVRLKYEGKRRELLREIKEDGALDALHQKEEYDALLSKTTSAYFKRMTKKLII